MLLSQAFAVDWQGHRGARGLYPENTIGSMEEALKYPVTTLELDVVVSKDNKVVVSHEPWMNEEICLSPGREQIEKKYNIYKLNYDEIVKFDCGSLGHKQFPEQKKVSVGKPTLRRLIKATEETLKKLNRTGVQYNIEIKSTPSQEKEKLQPDYRQFSDLVIKTAKDELPASRFTIQSFDWRVLKYLHEKYPDVRLVALLEGDVKPDKVISELGFKPEVFSPYYKNLKKKDVETFHKMGIKVIPWTINDVPTMKTFLKMGVDGIITDYPNLISEVLEPVCKKGSHYFNGKCISVPKNAVPSSSIPGWNCKEGYMQKRLRCVKIPVPPHAQILPDGKNWECKPGYRRYRHTCVK